MRNPFAAVHSVGVKMTVCSILQNSSAPHEEGGTLSVPPETANQLPCQ